MINLKLHRPDALTKQLSFQKISKVAHDKKLVISTNWLAIFGFEAGANVVETSLGANKGLEVKLVTKDSKLDMNYRTKKVYSRTYNQRRNSPVETLMDIRSKKLISESFPEQCDRVHITFLPGRLLIKPLLSHQVRALANARKAGAKLSAFCVCTSGIDAFSLKRNGFSVSSVAEYRPTEKRDRVDLSETGALTVIENIEGINKLYNEDISLIDLSEIKKDFATSPVTLLHATPLCDDYSTVKTLEQRQNSIKDLSSCIDQGYDLLRMIETIAPPTVLFENVSGWVSSPTYQMLSLRMKRWGYNEYILKADARDFGGLTSRKRAYSFFSVLPVDFEFEEKIPRNTTPMGILLDKYIPSFRDVSHSKSIQKGANGDRGRSFNDCSTHAPTPLKSQSRMCKDSVVYESKQGRLLMPSESGLKKLLGISSDFSLNSVSKTVASEIIGQSIEVPLHESVIRSVKSHIESFLYLLETPRFAVH